MKTHLPPNPMTAMPSYVGSLRRAIEAEFREWVRDIDPDLEVTVSATQRSDYVEVLVFVGPSVFRIGPVARVAEHDYMVARYQSAEQKMPQVMEEGQRKAKEIEDELAQQGHSVIIYVKKRRDT